MTGDKKVVKSPKLLLLDPEGETLSDMTIQALNHALEQIDEATKKKMGAFAGANRRFITKPSLWIREEGFLLASRKV